MGFLDRFGSKVEISVDTDRREYLPGELVTATIRVFATKDLQVEEARAELVCENEYEYRERDWDSKSVTDVDTHTTTERTVHAPQRFLEGGTLRAGEAAEHTVSLMLPAEAVPTGKGAITEVRWKLEAIVSRRHALDPDVAAGFSVLSPPDAYADAAAGVPELDTHGDCDLELRLRDGPHVRAGSTIAGAFVVTPRTEIDAGEVRVELVRREEVPRGAGNEDETVEVKLPLGDASDLSASIPREYPFELSVPAGACPTLTTEHSTVRWELRGVVSRRLRSDYNVRRPLNVYTGPAGEPVGDDGDARDDGVGVFKEPPGGGA